MNRLQAAGLPPRAPLLHTNEMSQILLIRYGTVPEVARFAHDLPEPPERRDPVVVNTHRGLELGTVLEAVRQTQPQAETEEPAYRVLRRATPEDESRHAQLAREAQAEFAQWQQRIRDWKLELELLDLEWTLDRQKLVLYVLGGRSADTTKLALQAAAAGLAVVEVQPVNAEGLVPLTSGGGGGCGSGGCGCEH
jgi:cell fate regulator YaaT (PSP1 superfamily)